MLRPTAAGRYAQAVWSHLEEPVDRRWRQRFGDDLVGALRAGLLALSGPDGEPAPLYLPIVAPAQGLRSNPISPSAEQLATAGVADPAEVGLVTLLSRVLLIFTADYEAESGLSLPMTAGMLAALTDRAVPMRQVPLLAGVSKEAAQAVLGYLERAGMVVTGADPLASRGRAVSLTARGRVARDRYGRLVGAVERGWEQRFGTGLVSDLRDVIAAFVSHRTGGEPTLALGLRPYENGWRARGRYRAQTRAVLAGPWTMLPRYPMILHRGGYPDGS